jgi:energy-coupling factor transporter transmembrane protein EcfT
VADARGFGATRARGSLRVHKLGPADIWGYAILVALVAGALILNHLHIGARFYG